MASEALKKAINKYNKHNTRNFTLKVNRNTEKEILDKLSNVENVNGYIKQLIKDDIDKK